MYYFFIDKIADLLSEEETRNTMAALSQLLHKNVADIEQGYAEWLELDFNQTRDAFILEDTGATFSYIFNRDGEVVFRDMTLLITGLGKDANGNMVYVTPLGPITICGATEVVEG